MLKDPLKRYSNVARELGISRQRMQQLAVSMRLPNGRERLGPRQVQHAEKLILEHFTFIPELRRQGFTVEPVIRYREGESPGISVRQLNINGYRCIVRATFCGPMVKHHWGDGYVCLGGYDPAPAKHNGVEFVIYPLCKGSPVEGYLVLPAAKAPDQNRVVKLRESLPAYKTRSYAIWHLYVNAWDQLKGVPPLETPEVVPAIEIDCVTTICASNCASTGPTISLSAGCREPR